MMNFIFHFIELLFNKANHKELCQNKWKYFLDEVIFLFINKIFKIYEKLKI